MKPITPSRRRVLRLPITLFRLRLGRLMGRRFLLLSHTGRRSGLPRRTVLEIAFRDGPTVYYLGSGWGARADWYQNLRVHPRAEIMVGTRSFEVEADILGAEESGHLMARYADEHPKAARTLARLVGWVPDDGLDWYRLGHDQIPWVRLTVVR